MTIEERIEWLENAIKEQEAQRDWLLDVEWRDISGNAEAAASEQDRVIELYQMIIKRLREQP